MNKFLGVTLLVLIAYSVLAQERVYPTFYHQRTTLFEELPVTSKDIIFLGNSITNGAEWHELLRNKHVKNRGISGDICWGVYDRLTPILKGKPAKIFLLIGINDLNKGVPPDTILYRIGLITAKIRQESPKTKLYLQSVLPVTDYYRMFSGHTRHWKIIKEINEKLEQLARKQQVVYIDLYAHFADATGKMKIDYTNDGLHLVGKGYLKWAEIIKSYVNKK